MLRSLGTDGFLEDEASTNAIVVRERPVSDRDASYESCLEYNFKKSSRDELPAGANSLKDHVQYANIADCGLLNVGRAIVHKLTWGA